MSQRKGFIPANKDDFDKFFRDIVQYVIEKTTGATPQWKHIPKEDQDGLNAAYSAWYTAYCLTLLPHSYLVTREKNRVRKLVEKQLREFVNCFLRHKPVTDADRDAMRIPNRAKVKTAVSKPYEEVEFTLEQKGNGRVLVHFRVKGSLSKGRPYGYKGAAVKWAVSDKPATKISELRDDAESATKTPLLIELNEDLRGKVVSVACRWENRRNGKGPWSPIQWTIVP
jgi:hypothetical protein